MTPERINRYAMWATVGILAVAAVGFAVVWASSPSGSQNPDVGISQADLSDTSLGTGIAPVAEPVASSGGTPPTHPQPSGVLDAHIKATIDTSPNPTDVTRPSTTNAPTTTGTTRPQTQPAATTPPSAPTTTILTTTTLPTATSTTFVPTTTTMPTATTTTTMPTATTTTAPATTTTSTIPSDLPVLFVERFAAQPGGDEDDWSIDLAVTIGGTSGGTYRAQIYISWSGNTSGSTVLTTGGSGNAAATIGSFSSDTVTVAITNVQASSWVYEPGLNQASTTLKIQAPDD